VGRTITHTDQRIVIDVFDIRVPEGVFLSAEEKGVLHILQERLRDGERASDTDVEGDGEEGADGQGRG